MPARRLTGRATAAALAVVALGQMGGCGGGFLGLQDYQRDLLFGLGGGLAGALLGQHQPDDPPDAGQPGPAGPPGARGPEGPPLFVSFVDSFYAAAADDALGVTPVLIDEPALGAGQGPVAFLVVLPATLPSGNPLAMRLLLFRTGPCDGGCFAFTVDARRAPADAGTVECFGGSAADCSDGTRWVRLADACEDAAPDDVERFLVVVLPLDAGGLELGSASAGDVLAFELNAATDDGGTYHLLGVEISDAESDPRSNARAVYTARSQLPPECAEP